MIGPDDSILFTIGEAVAEIQRTYPDVSHSSLRFLQREGLIHPRRTRGGHRQYSAADIARVRLIKRWQTDRLSLAEIRERLTDFDTLASPDDMVTHLLDHAIAGDTHAAMEQVLLADELGLPLGHLFDKVICPVLHDIGERWVAGSLLVGQEHQISEAIRDLVAELSYRHNRPGPRGPLIVVACVEHELHELGLLMVAAMLRKDGARVHYLGANVSPVFLAEVVRLRQPEVVLLSATIDSHLPGIRASIDAIQALPDIVRSPRIIVGGAASRTHQRELTRWGGTVIPNVDLETVAGIILEA